MKLALFAALVLTMAYTAACTPGMPPSPSPPPTPTATVPDAGPDHLALDLCIENFAALNPGLSPSEIEALFCTGPDALAPWSRRAPTTPLDAPDRCGH